VFIEPVSVEKEAEGIYTGCLIVATKPCVELQE